MFIVKERGARVPVDGTDDYETCAPKDGEAESTNFRRFFREACRRVWELQVHGELSVGRRDGMRLTSDEFFDVIHDEVEQLVVALKSAGD